MAISVFAQQVIPLVVYLGAVMAVLYYIGLTTYVTEKVGWLMSISLQTTAVESMSLVANIFLSVVSIILVFIPFRCIHSLNVFWFSTVRYYLHDETIPRRPHKFWVALFPCWSSQYYSRLCLWHYHHIWSKFGIGGKSSSQYQCSGPSLCIAIIVFRFI